MSVRRVYICDGCSSIFEIYQGMHDKLKKKCPECKKMKLYQDLTGVYVYDSSPKTIGAAADRNRDKMGVYERQETDQRDKERMDRPRVEELKRQGILPQSATTVPDHKPWYNPGGKDKLKKIGNMTPTQKKDYILYGKE